MPDETSSQSRGGSSAQSRAGSSAQGYHTKEWGGKTAYECDSCPFDSFNEDRVKAHVQAPGHRDAKP